VPRHLADALGVREQPQASLHDQLVERLRAGEPLLVLDNCEHLLPACAELAQRLLADCASLRILATSRRLLGLPGEADYPLPPLRLPAAEAGPEELRASEAVALLLARARTARPRLRQDAAVLASAGRICRDLDGLPLAIELAAARAKALSLEEIAARLADRFRFLVSWRRLATARHRTLREALNWSYELLAAEEQALLANLSVFAGGFTLAAAAHVCLQGDEERALALVERLLDGSLVLAEEREGGMRYRLLETVRQYAAQKLAEDPNAVTEGMRAHGQFFAELVDEGDARRPDEAQGTLVDDDLENFRAAIDHAAARGDGETELRLVSGL
jgi:predicted ATPase